MMPEALKFGMMSKMMDLTLGPPNLSNLLRPRRTGRGK